MFKHELMKFLKEKQKRSAGTKWRKEMPKIELLVCTYLINMD